MASPPGLSLLLTAVLGVVGALQWGIWKLAASAAVGAGAEVLAEGQSPTAAQVLTLQALNPPPGSADPVRAGTTGRVIRGPRQSPDEEGMTEQTRLSSAALGASEPFVTPCRVSFGVAPRPRPPRCRVTDRCAPGAIAHGGEENRALVPRADRLALARGARGIRWVVAIDKSWNVSLPQDFVGAIRRLAGDLPDVFGMDAVRQEIQRCDQVAAIREAAGTWKDHDGIPDTVEELVDFMRRLRAGEQRFPQ